MSTPALSLLTFHSGDTDYVSKLNTNSDSITTAVNALFQTGVAVNAASLQLFLIAMYGTTPGIIGSTSFTVSVTSSSIATNSQLSFSKGYSWRPQSNTIVGNASSVNFDFSNKAAGDYYMELNSVGIWVFSPNNAPTSALMKVTVVLVPGRFSGMFGEITSITRLVNVYPNALDTAIAPAVVYP